MNHWFTIVGKIDTTVNNGDITPLTEWVSMTTLASIEDDDEILFLTNS